MRYVVLNLRFLLWRNEVDRANWPDHLVTHLRYERCRAEELLQGSVPRVEERDRIADFFGVSREVLETVNLVEQEAELDVVGENLRRLIGGLDHGDRKRLAEVIGVRPGTISRWQRDQPPSEPNLRELCRYFRLPSVEYLREEPIFLSPAPISTAEQRAWIRERANRLDAVALQSLFPALERVMGER